MAGKFLLHCPFLKILENSENPHPFIQKTESQKFYRAHTETNLVTKFVLESKVRNNAFPKFLVRLSAHLLWILIQIAEGDYTITTQGSAGWVKRQKTVSADHHWYQVI